MSDFDSRSVDSIIRYLPPVHYNHDRSPTPVSCERIQNYMRPQLKTLLSGDDIGLLVRTVYRNFSVHVAEEVVSALVKEINWNRFERNPLLDGMVSVYKHKYAYSEVIVPEIVLRLEHEGPNCSFFLWLRDYVPRCGETDVSLKHIVSSVMRRLFESNPSLAKITLIPVIKRNIHSVIEHMPNGTVASWHRWFTRDLISSRLIQSLAANAHLSCKTSPLVLMQIISRLRSDEQLHEFVDNVEWSLVFENLFYCEDALVVAMCIFAPSTLPHFGYHVSFTIVEGNCLQASAQMQLGEIFSRKKGANTKKEVVRCHQELSGYFADRVGHGHLMKKINQPAESGRLLGKLYFSIRHMQNLRSFVFPHASAFIQSANFPALRVKGACILVSKVLVSCRGEDGIGPLLTEVANYVASLNLFVEREELSYHVGGIHCLIRENVKCDAVSHQSLKDIMTTEELRKVQWFSVPFIKKLVECRNVHLYSQHRGGLLILRLLEETGIAEVVSRIPRHVFELARRQRNGSV